MLRIGLTGGIGCGKSTACRLFKELGVEIVDADLIARQLVEPGQPALHQLAENFGREIINADGSLDRAKLRELAFNNAIIKAQLENILHPLIYNQIAAQIENLRGGYCVVAVPLLLETQKSHTVDRVLVVDCSEELQIQRAIDRDKQSREQILSIISKQMPRKQRLDLADDILDNSSTPSQLAEQIKRLHNSYILLATVRTSSA